MPGRPWTAEEIALLGTIPDGEVAGIVGRSKNAVAQQRAKRKIPVFHGDLLSLTEAADFAGVPKTTINSWRAAGLLSLSPEARGRLRYSAEAVTAARAKAVDRREAHRPALQRSIARAQKHRRRVPRGKWGVRRVREELKRHGILASRSTVYRWVRREWLKHAGPVRKTSADRFAFRPRDVRKLIARLPALRADATKTAHRHAAQATIAKATTAPGILSRSQAALRANKSENAVSDAVARGELKPCSTRPLRFAVQTVDDWRHRTPPRGPDDIPVTELAAMIPGAPPTARHTLYRLARNGELPTYKRSCTTADGKQRETKCIHRNRLETVAGYFKRSRRTRIKNLLPARHSRPEAPELTIQEAANHYKQPYGTIYSRLKSLAPSAGRSIQNSAANRNASPRVTVFPVAAIEAALRGKTWTPPQPANGEPPPAAAPPAEDRRTKSERKRGRPNKEDRDAEIRRRAKAQGLLREPAKLTKLLNEDAEFVDRFEKISKSAVRHVLLSLRRTQHRAEKA